MGTFALAIDFGSSNTAAAYRDRAGTVHELRLTTTGTLMPSAVLYRKGRILVGRTAMQAAFTEPDAFEPTPKRRLADGEILLGGTLVPVIDLVAAVLKEVLGRARQVMGAEPEEVILTHPEQWAAQRKEALATAAGMAGVEEDRLHLLSEPQAAAWFYAASAPDVDELTRLAVFDFGAGTCDVAVLDREADNSFVVVASDGVEGLGGQDLDARVHSWVRRQLAVRDTALLAEIDDPQSVATRTALNDRIREAKEALSEATSAAIAVSGSAGTQNLQLTRDELDSLITPDIARAVRLTKSVLDSAKNRQPPPHTPTIYLTGGSSHIPLVHIELGKFAPLGVLGDPKTVVVQGALLQSPPTPVAGDTPPVSSSPSAVPVTGAGMGAVGPTEALSEPPANPAADSDTGSSRTRTAQPGESRRPATKWLVGGAAGLVIVFVAAIVAMTTRHHEQTPQTVRPPQLSSILLSVNAINAVMGASNMQISQSADGLRQPVDRVLDEAGGRCRGTLHGMQQPVYQGSGYTAVSDQLLREPNNVTHLVEQAAVGYPWEALALKFLKTSTDNWNACAGKSVTIATPGTTERWVIGDLTVRDNLIAQLSSKEAGKGWSCQHALRAVSNVVLDVVACGYEVVNQAVEITDKMAAKPNG